MREQNGVGAGKEAGVDVGLVFEDVEAARAYFAAVERVDEGGFVDEGAACRVDEHDAVLHLGELGRAEDVRGGRVEGEVQAQDVRGLEQGVEADVVRAVFLLGG